MKDIIFLILLSLVVAWLIYLIFTKLVMPIFFSNEEGISECPKPGCHCTFFIERTDGFVQCQDCSIVFNPKNGQLHPLDFLSRCQACKNTLDHREDGLLECQSCFLVFDKQGQRRYVHIIGID